MYKVMLVDDDYPVIEFLEQEIPWEELQLNLIGFAEDGLVALEQAKREMPDLLITDIGMPGMNGLELVSELKKIHPDIQVIILSCHDDFQYARQAVKLSVHDYVLKETMEIEEISDALRKLVIQIDDKKNSQKTKQELIQLVNQNQSVLKDKMMHSLLNTPLLNEMEWQSKLSDVGVQLSTKSYVPVICYINRYGKQLSRYQSAEALQYAVNNIVTELVNIDGEAICFQLNRKEILLLFPYTGTVKESTFKYIDMALKQLQRAAQNFIKVGLSFIVSERSCGDVQALKKAIQKLQVLKDSRFYLSDSVVTKSEHLELNYKQDDIFQYYEKMSDSFKSVLTESRVSTIRKEVSHWTAFFKSRVFHPEDVKSLTLKVAMDFQMKLRAAHSFDSAIFLEQLHTSIISTESIYELEDELDHFLHSMFSSLSDLNNKSTRKDILTAQKYVTEHLHHKITMEEIAEMLHLNASYFSRLFKKETKESFIVYVTRLKMEKAKEYLETTDKTVEDIAYQLGYEKKSYFSKCFKSFYGEAPSRLRST